MSNGNLHTMCEVTSNHNETFDLTKLNNHGFLSSFNMALVDGDTCDDIKPCVVGNPMNLTCVETINFDDMDKSEIESSVHEVCNEDVKPCIVIKSEPEASMNDTFEDGVVTDEMNKSLTFTKTVDNNMINSGIQDSTNTVQKVGNSSKKSVATSFGNCSLCSLTLQRRSSYCNHILTHLGAIPFYCKICFSYFITELQLQHHMLKHTNESLYLTTKTTLFRCNMCNITYTAFNHLAEHYLSHILKMPFKCDVCNLYFAEELDYLIHQHYHSENLQCTICCAICHNRKDKLQHVISHQPLKFFRKLHLVLGVRRKEISKQINHIEENTIQSTHAVGQVDALNSSNSINKMHNSKLASLLSGKTSNELNDTEYTNFNNRKLNDVNVNKDSLLNNASVQQSSLIDVAQVCEVVLDEDSSNSICDYQTKIVNNENGFPVENNYNSIHNAVGDSIHCNNVSDRMKMINKYKYFQMYNKVLNDPNSFMRNSSSSMSRNSEESPITSKTLMPSTWNFNPTNQIKNIEKKMNKHLNESITLNNENRTLSSDTHNIHSPSNNITVNNSLRSLAEDFNITNSRSKKKKIRKSDSKKKQKKLKKKKSLHKKFALKKCSVVLQKFPLYVRDYRTYQMFIKSLKLSYNNVEVIPQEKYEKYLMKLNAKFCDDNSVKDMLKYISKLKKMHEKSLSLDKEFNFALCELSKVIYGKYSCKNTNCVEISEQNGQSNSKFQNEQFPSGETSNGNKIMNSDIVSIKKRMQMIKKSLARISGNKKEKNINQPSVVLYRLPQYIYDAYCKQKPIMISNVLPIICDVQSLTKNNLKV